MKGFISTIKLRQLEYFVAVAEMLNFTKAARALAVTQPTLSHQIAELEDHVGLPLFDRRGKSVRLTEAGSLFRAYAVRAIKELEAGRTALDELEGLLRGDLRIGVIQSFSRTLLPPMLGDFMICYPNVRLHIDELTANEIEQRLAAGRLDLGVAFAQTETESCEIEAVLEEEMLLLVGAGHGLDRRGRVMMRELDGQRMAMLGLGFSTRRMIDRYLETAGARPVVVCETNSLEVMFGAVAEGGAAAIVPEKAIGQRRPGVRVLRLCEPKPLRTSALLWPRSSFRSTAARTFAQLVHDRLLSAPAATRDLLPAARVTS